MTTTTAPQNAVSPETVAQLHLTGEYERMLVERQRTEVPAVFRSLRKRTAPRRDPEANHSHFEVNVAYLPLLVGLPYVKRIPFKPIVLPPLLPACVTTILAPPYLYASDERIETGALTGPLSYSFGHKEDGSVEVMAQVLGTDTGAQLYDDMYRGRIAAGFLLAGVYTVPASSGAVEVAIAAPVKAAGTSVIFEEAPTSLGLVQLSARMDVLRVGGTTTSNSENLHCHTWGFPPVTVSKVLAADAVLSTVIPVAAGDQLFIFLYAEARLFVQDGESIVAVLNVSSDGSVINGGSVSFPYVEIRLC